MIRRILLLLLVLAMLAGTFFLWPPGSGRDQAPVSFAPLANSGYSSRDAEIIETGADGRPRYRLEADRIDQQPLSGEVSLTRVTMQYRTELGSEWRLRADRGLLPEDARDVELEGAVKIEGPFGPGPSPHGALEMTTERLHVDTVDEIVTTLAPVTVLWSGQRLESLGIRGDLKRQQLQLEAHVHGRFVAR